MVCGSANENMMRTVGDVNTQLQQSVNGVLAPLAYRGGMRRRRRTVRRVMKRNKRGSRSKKSRKMTRRRR